MTGVLEEKSLKFAIRIVNLYKYLVNEKRETVMSKQVLRAGTSIGANIAEAQYAQSKADFLSKMHISLKEASETRFWLKLLHSTSYINDSHMSIMNDCDELLRLLTSTCKTTKKEQPCDD